MPIEHGRALHARRVLTVTRRVLRQLRRDPSSIAILLVQPIVIITIFAYSFGADVSGVRVAVADLDRGTQSEEVLDRLDRTVLDLRFVETEAEVERAVREQQVRVGLVFPSNFTRNLESAATADAQKAFVIVYEDNTNFQVTGQVLEELLDALDDAFEEDLEEVGGLDLDERVLFGVEDARNIDFFMPGIIAYTIFMLGSLLTVLAVVKERALGTIDRVLATPASKIEVILGYVLGFGVFSFLQGVVVLTAAILLFGVSVAGSVAVVLLIVTVVGLMALGMGILVSSFARTDQQAIQAVFLVAFPTLFLGGVFAPFETLPWFLRPIARVIPFTYAVDALRGVVSYGFDLRTIAGDVAVVALFALAFLVAAARFYGRRTS